MPFPDDITKRLRHYVYRLIDPRNGETFDVGRGQGNRVFAHAAGQAGDNGDELSDKLRRIREIRAAGFEVAHVIHRHGLDEAAAREVEAALIDAYPGLTNLQGGQDSGDRGVMHADEITRLWSAEPAQFRHKIMLINVNRWTGDTPLYDQVRYAWKVKPERARRAEYVLAVKRGSILGHGAFVAVEWLPATEENFPGFPEADPKRWGFRGCDAPEDIQALYQRKRVPEKFLGQQPIRYTFR